MSLLMICEILELFVNTLTADDIYSLRNSEVSQQPIKMQLSKKRMNLLQFFIPFPKPASILEHFEKKDDFHSLYISEVTECERSS